MTTLGTPDVRRDAFRRWAEADANDAVTGVGTPSTVLGSTVLIEGLIFVLCVLALVAPAVWNGYPLIYYDSEDYVNMSFTFDLVIWRTMPYALLVSVGRLFDSLFPVVVLQSMLVAWVLHELAAAFLPRRPRLGFLLLTLVATLLTSLPWYTAQLMPDALAGLPVLGIAILAFGRRLAVWRQVLLVVVVAVAVASHMSHLAVAAGVLVVLTLLRAGARRWPGWPLPALGTAVVAVAIGTVLVPAVHKWADGKAVFSNSGRVLQLALFVQNGSAKRYLDEVCPRGARLKLCPYRNRLPKTANDFLWDWRISPFHKVGGWQKMLGESENIVEGVVERFPAQVVVQAVANFATQMSMLRVGDGLGPKVATPGQFAPGQYYGTASARYPNEFERYLAARQQQGDGIDFGAVNALHVPVAVAMQLGLLGLLILSWRRGDRAGVGLGVLIVLALLGNAVICGAVSNPNDRYQNRIVWIAAAGCAVLLVRMRGDRSSGAARA